MTSRGFESRADLYACKKVSYDGVARDLGMRRAPCLGDDDVEDGIMARTEAR